MKLDNLTENESDKLIELKEIIFCAKNNFLIAQCLLGLIYKLGYYGLEKNEEKAIFWITKSASHGHTISQEILAGYYGCEKMDYEKSWNWALKAASGGSNAAMRLLAGYTSFGKGCEIDHVESIKWLLLSASSGDAASKKWLLELDDKINVFKSNEFFCGYYLAERWLKCNRNTGIKLDQQYKEKLQSLI